MKRSIKVLVFILTVIGTTTMFLMGLIFVVTYPTHGSGIPAAETPYFFDELGAVKELQFRPRPFKNYHVALVNGKPFPMNQVFNWKVKYVILNGGRVVYEGDLEECTRVYVSSELGYVDLERGDEVNFATIFQSGLIPNELTMQLSVEKPDLKTSEYFSEAKVVVRVHNYK